MSIFDKSGVTLFGRTLSQPIALGLVVAIGLLVPIGLQALAFAKRSSNSDLREALQHVQSARSEIAERTSKKDHVAARYVKKAPPLAGYMDQAARALKLEVADSNDRPDVAIGKKYTERYTVIHIRKAGLLPLIRFLETIEKSGHPMIVQRLNVRKRSGEANAYDVEVGVAAYDRALAPVTVATDKDKPK